MMIIITIIISIIFNYLRLTSQKLKIFQMQMICYLKSMSSFTIIQIVTAISFSLNIFLCLFRLFFMSDINVMSKTIWEMFPDVIEKLTTRKRKKQEGSIMVTYVLTTLSRGKFLNNFSHWSAALLMAQVHIYSFCEISRKYYQNSRI